jgi:hypothetical protein
MQHNTTPADHFQAGGDHYKTMAIQPWAVMEAVLTPAEFRGFLKGNIVKYSMRNGQKPGSHDDAAKALHYKQKLEEFNAARSALFAGQKGAAE